MKCLYINLDREAGRRERIEASFARVPHDGWTLERFAAIDGDRDAASLPPGRCRPSQKACLLSHTAARRLAAASDEPTLIVEDDCLFHERSFALLDQLLASMPAKSWQMLFLDVGITSPDEMIALFRLRRQWSLSAPGACYEGPVQWLDLKQLQFIGASAYLVTPDCAASLARTVAAMPQLNAPNDTILRDVIHSGQVQASVVFPFLTTLSDDADHSANQLPVYGLTEFLWNSYRRLVWIGADAATIGESLHRRIPPDHVDPEAQLFQQILGGCLSSNFINK